MVERQVRDSQKGDAQSSRESTRETGFVKRRIKAKSSKVKSLKEEQELAMPENPSDTTHKMISRKKKATALETVRDKNGQWSTRRTCLAKVTIRHNQTQWAEVFKKRSKRKNRKCTILCSRIVFCWKKPKKSDENCEQIPQGKGIPRDLERNRNSLGYQTGKQWTAADPSSAE